MSNSDKGMRLDPRKPENISEGDVVEISDLKSEQLVKGTVTKIVSNSYHPEGVFVKLDNDKKGHTQKILRKKPEYSSNQNSDQSIETVELQPEDFKLEYKETMFNYGPEEEDWIPPFTIFKAIASLANAEGGQLIIGVKDEKNKPLVVTGMKKDFERVSTKKMDKKRYYSGDSDGFTLYISTLFAHYFPQQEDAEHLTRIQWIGEKTETMICIINVKRSTEAVIHYDSDAMKNKGPNFYVRVNNKTKKHTAQSFIRYWMKHIISISNEERIILS